MDVAGSSVLITGASAGIGEALADALATRGTRLGLVGRDGERLRAVADRCRAQGIDVHEWQLDLGDLEAVDRLVVESWATLDGIDVLVNNAAMPKRRHVLALSDDEVEEVMRVTPAVSL